MKKNPHDGVLDDGVLGWALSHEIAQLPKPIRSSCESFFSPSVCSNPALARDGGFTPRADVHEDRNGLKLRIEIPEFRPDDVDIALDGKKLTVKGERKLPERNIAGVDLAMESCCGPFFRTFVLPDWVDRATLTANYVNGALEIVMAKRAEVRPKQVPVELEAAALGIGAPALQPA